MKKTDKELILLGKRHVIEERYNETACWQCEKKPTIPICVWCKKHNKQNETFWVWNLSDTEVESLYEEINKRG